MAERALVVNLVSDSRRFSKGFDDAQRRVNSFSRRLDATTQTTFGRLNGRIDAVTSSLRSMTGILAGGAAAAAIARFAQSSIRAFSDLTESINAVNVTFGEAASTVLRFGENAAESVGLAQSEFNQLVTPIGAMLRNFGLNAGEAADAAIQLTQRAADLASVFNTDVSDALTAIQAALRGETDPIERFGASISAARVESFALSQGLASSRSEIDDTIKVQARLGLILQDTARVAGDFVDTSDELANRQRILSARFTDLQADLGRRLVPTFEELLGVADDLLPVFADLAEDALPVLIDAFTDFAVGVQTIIEGFDALPGPIQGAVVGIGALAGALRLAVANPVIAGLAAVAAGIGFIGNAVRENREDVDQFLQILQDLPDIDVPEPPDIDEFSEAFEELRRTVAQRLQEEGILGDLTRFGLTLGDVTRAILGEAEGLDALNQAFNIDPLDPRKQAAVNLEAEINAIRRDREAASAAIREQRELERELRAAERIETPSDPDLLAVNRVRALSDAFTQAREPVKTYAQVVRERMAEIRGVIAEAAEQIVEDLEKQADAFVTPFEEAPEFDTTAAAELLDNAQTRLSQMSEFFAGVQRLVEADLGALAADFAAAGPETLGALRGVLEDLDSGGANAFALNETLEKGETEMSRLAQTLGTALAAEQEGVFREFFLFGQGATRQLLAGIDSVNARISVDPEIISAPTRGPGHNFGSIGRRALGGPVSPNQPFLVGENGPEVFFPESRGRIAPLGPASASQVHIHLTTLPADEPERQLQKGLLLAGVSRSVEVT